MSDVNDRQITDLQKAVANIKDEQEVQGKELVFIKLQLTNHIPHTLEDHGKILASLDARLKPIETKDIKISGVSEFLTLLVKAMAIITAIVWTAIQISHYCKLGT